jgi:xanthine dehydrogenase accessory factor
MSLYCFRQLASILKTESAVLGTVISVKGSVPREVGAKIIICSGDRFFNTIGGGAGEALVIREGAAVLETGEKKIVEIDLSGARQRETQGICGGIMEVLLEHWSGENSIKLVQQILNQLESGKNCTLITPLDIHQSPYLQPQPRENININNIINIINIPNVFVEILQPPPTLLIIGAGHVGEQLAKVAAIAGFEIIIQDDRLEWANSTRYPQGKIYNQPISEIINELASHTQLYIALVTRGFDYDLEALQALLQRKIKTQYIGMIGSKKRVSQVYQAIETIAREDKNQLESQLQGKLQSIHAPIGLDIGAITPEEIAVSICAELIMIRRGGTGKPLSHDFHD